MQALERAIVQGLDRPFVIHTPLMHIDKADTFLLAQELGVLDLILEESHTCYEGDHTTRHAWGYGCGACPACELRARGWHAYKERHP